MLARQMDGLREGAARGGSSAAILPGVWTRSKNACRASKNSCAPVHASI
jgi:hypothetical protein